jgi:hypothetical protein
VQFNLFLAYFQFGLPLLTIGILLTILRVIAVKRYHAERLTEGKTTSLGNLGKNLANTQFLTFNITWSVTLAVGLLFVVMSLLMPFFEQLGYENMILPLGVFALVLMIVTGLFSTVTVRGRAILWRGRISSNYMQYGHQEWVIQKRLAELVREKEGSDRFRAKVAQKALESLMTQEDMTGDAVRRIMADPAGPIDRFEDRTIPSILWEFKFSYSLMTFSYAGVLVVAWASAVGIISDSSVTTTAVIIFMGLVLLSVCCMLTEGYMASRNRMRFLPVKDSP